MAWFGEGLSSLSNLKGQITSFTKDVLSEGIVEEIDERSRNLNEVNERCVQLQELLTTKDAEISLLRRQNCELQKAVVELNAKPKDSLSQIDGKQQDEDDETFFWDSVATKNRNPKNYARQLQEQLSQATVRIRELETELKRLQKVNSSSIKDEINDGHQKAEFHRAKQDMMNRIIQMEKKTRETERNAKRIQLDELTIINDFRTVISKLESPEKLNLVRGALKALETENEKDKLSKEEKSKFDEKAKRINENGSDVDANNVDLVKRNDEVTDLSPNREAELYKKIEELNQDNKNLFANIEELDRQHAESIEELLGLKRDLEKKHHCLQNAYEQLYVDYNQAEAKAMDLQNKLKYAGTNKVIPLTVNVSLQTEIVQSTECDAQTDLPFDNEIDTSSNNLDLIELEHRIKDILKNSCVNAEPGETIFETVAKQYVDTKWKKDVLERKLTEVTRDMKVTTTLKDSLQMECDDMQSHIDSLLMEVQRLKQNLPSIPEACEDRVASLETETETLQEDIKRLQAENDELWKKNAELTNAIRDFEITFRNQDSLEPEIRNTGEQVDLMADPVERSKSAENEEDFDENTDNRKSNLMSLRNDTELHKSIDYTEDSDKELREELRITLEKYKTLEKNVESNESMRKELEQSKKMLNDALNTIKGLENDVATLESAKNGLEENNAELAQENEELIAELNRSKNVSSQSEDNGLIKELKEQLEISNREKNNLEYDILHMSNVLNASLNQAEAKHGQIQKLSKENETLTMQNTLLNDQINAMRNESTEEIARLGMEKSILEEEQTEAKQEIFNNHEELIKLKEKLHETESKHAKLAEKSLALESRSEDLQTENERLLNEMKRFSELEKQLTLSKTAEEELITLRGMFEKVKKEYTKLQDDFSALHLKSEKLQKENVELQNTELQLKMITDELNSMRSRNEEMASAVEELQTCRRDIETLEEKLHLDRCTVETLQTENSKLKSIVNEHIHCENERERLVSALNDKTKENDTLKIENDKLLASVALNEATSNVIAESKKNAAMMEDEIGRLSNLLKEKDEEINALKSSALSKDANADTLKDYSTIKNERDELLKYVQIKHAECVQYHAEIQRLSQVLTEQTSQMQALIAERVSNVTALEAKDAELLSARNELQLIQQRLKEVKESDDGKEVCSVTAHSEQTREIAILNEKCNAMEAALIQEQSSNRLLQNQLSESQMKEANAGKELERLRTHLVEMESSYTEEAVIAEETRKELEAKLLQAEEKVKNSSTVYTSASIRANQQVETLQQQIALIVQQRDDIQHKLSLAEDKILTQTASLTNLQLVLEQFQRDKEKDIIMTTERLQNKLQESYETQEKLASEVSDLKEQLSDAKECLQAASRLSKQLDTKTEEIEHLNLEVNRLTELVDTADQRIQAVRQTEESKVDKTLVKNLLLGYLSSSAADKSSVLRVVATVLDFNERERDKAGLNSTGNAGWFARLSSGSTAMPTKDQEVSLSAAFVRFLESESKPKPQLPALPISSSPLPKPTHSRQHSASSTNQSTLLLPNVSLPTFPDFVPARNTGSILKEVLRDS